MPVGRGAKDKKKGVAMGTDFIPPFLSQRSAQNVVVWEEIPGTPTPQPPQQLGRTLNVGKEKCDCACRCCEHIQMKLVGRFLRQANAAMPIISRFVCEPSQTKSCRNMPRSKKPVSRSRTEPLATTKRASPLKNGRRACSQRCRGIPYGTNRSQGPRPVYADLTSQEPPLCFA